MKHRLLCLAAVAFLAPMSMLAQITGVLTGKVTDTEGKPVIAVLVERFDQKFVLRHPTTADGFGGSARWKSVSRW